MAVDDDARAWVLALRWLDIALRQLEFYRDVVNTDLPSGWSAVDYPSVTDMRAINLRFAQPHFLLIAAHQAADHLGRLPAKAGQVSAPQPIGQLEDLDDMRNLYEHWLEQGESFRDPTVPKTRSGRSLTQRHPGLHPGIASWDKLGPIDLVELEADLSKARFAVVECLREVLTTHGLALRD